MVLKKELNKEPGPIGIFDSGYGGLTILKEISKQLPQYDVIAPKGKLKIFSDLGLRILHQ